MRKGKAFQADGRTSVDVRCQSCNRRWFHLRGTADKGLDKFSSGRARGIYFVKWLGESEFIPPEWDDPWKGKTTRLRPQVTVDPYAAEVVQVPEGYNGQMIPRLARQRYRVTCRSQCGRPPVVVTVERLERLFLEAIKRGQPDTAL